ncbi:unnamed protein product [Linum trigynum]|uniref:Uncharacterized protein n=1 Tax=Linum trigynum TaxID=586398 RepID=A0AAV2DY28_9ROSI
MVSRRRLPLKWTESQRRDGDGLTEFDGQRSGEGRDMMETELGGDDACSGFGLLSVESCSCLLALGWSFH